MGQRVTLEDIARHSEVSLATVSLALRDKPGITDETRQRVLDAARNLGYRKRPQPEATAPQTLRQIGLLDAAHSDERPQNNPFYGPILAGIEQACRRQQTSLFYAHVPFDDDNHPLELPRILLEGDLDGLLLIGAFLDANIEAVMERREIPTVLVDAYASNNRFDAVVSDNVGGAYEAVKYLIEHGHRQIGLVGSLPQAYPSIADRRRGYIQALQDHGIAETHFADCHIVLGQAFEATTNLLRRTPQITALFCCNDLMAVAAMQAAQALGRRLPDELSIIGFDDIDLAEHVTPALTTMRVDKLSMGRQAVHLLSTRAEFPNASLMTTVLRPTLIERNSVRRISS